MVTMVTHKGIWYFPSYKSAREAARHAGAPTNRIILYGRGWAIQREPSGPYLGPKGWA